ncbi:phage portal protein [Sphingosinicella sp. YJ22]|uniref:phage portal protein n=1 Tax=Sphingosinicella sp. YJ22 TaxID=1104780 RepID=UPI00140E5D0D|nr:phage portal protein [Sphingosinicella sp. YJ22]
MKWFGRKGAREAARPFLLRGLWGQAGEPLPRSYEAQVRAAYLGNAVAQRAVRLVAEALASITIDASGRADGSTPMGFGQAVSLIDPALLESIGTQLLLHGNAFVHVAQDGEGQPARLFPLRPERVKVEPDGTGWPTSYLYRIGETKRRFQIRDGLGRPEVMHIRSVHPLDDHYGLGCLGAAAAAVAVHNAAGRWNKALLDNAARPSGALVYQPDDGAALSPAQFERLREEMEAQFAGAGNAGRPLLLDGGLKWQAMSLSPADMDFVALKAGAAREIALVFGVPPMLLGLPGDNTYANYREAVRSLWRLTVLPMADRVLGALSEGLGAWWPGLRLAVDIDQVSALHGDRAELWAAVSAADFLTRDEKREMLGFSREQA